MKRSSALDVAHLRVTVVCAPAGSVRGNVIQMEAAGVKQG